MKFGNRISVLADRVLSVMRPKLRCPQCGGQLELVSHEMDSNGGWCMVSFLLYRCSRCGRPERRSCYYDDGH